MSTFLSSVLSKKYTNPSSDIITILAGLDQIDALFTDFVGSLDFIIRNDKRSEWRIIERWRGAQAEYASTDAMLYFVSVAAVRQKAVEVALAITSGAYQTSLLTYFIQRDMFPSVMKVGNLQHKPTAHFLWLCAMSNEKPGQQLIQDAEATHEISKPFTLIGLLANYNKFEFQNPYQLRLNDFVNEDTIQQIIRSVGGACQDLRTQYVDIQDDSPEGWSLSSTLNLFGLGAIAPGPKPDKKPVYDAETAKKMFTEL